MKQQHHDKADIITKLLQKCSIQRFVNQPHNKQEYHLCSAGIKDSDVEKVLYTLLQIQHPRLKGGDYIIVNSKTPATSRSIKTMLMSKPEIYHYRDSDKFGLVTIKHETHSEDVVFNLIFDSTSKEILADMSSLDTANQLE